MGRESLLQRVSPFLPRPCDLGNVSGISTTFAVLSWTEGQVAHVLLTRPPLTATPKGCDPFDLHVLSTPPAFVLSQDQTLTKLLGSSRLALYIRTFARCSYCSVFKDRVRQSQDMILCAFEASVNRNLLERILGGPNRIRTGVTALRARRPWPLDDWAETLVGEEGFEPSLTEPESVVLPLHHSPTSARISIAPAQVGRNRSGVVLEEAREHAQTA